MDRTLDLLSGYAASLSYDDLPASTISAVKQRVIDSIGCALGAYLAEPCKVARRLCYAIESPFTARLIGSLTRTTPEMAAFANGTMVRYLDFNDALRVKDGGHPSDVLSAVLSVGEAVHTDGKSLITAAVLAYEIPVRVIEAASLEQRGWDQPVYLVLGCALGAGKILGLTKEQLSNAASLAVVPNVALYQNRMGELSMWKAAAAGMAARQGIFAALMAREGMSGPEEAFEGRYGLMNQVTGPVTFEPLGGKKRQFGVERTNLKSYPVRDSCQIVVATALELRKKVPPAQIKSLKVRTYGSAYMTAAAPRQLWAPKTRETADHSIPFCIAAALLDGNVSVETFSRKRFLDSEVLDLMGRMQIEEDPGFTKETPGKRNCWIEATTKSGDMIVAHKIISAEELLKPWRNEQVEAKFLTLAGTILTPAQARACLDLLWRLEDLDDAAGILDNLQA